MENLRHHCRFCLKSIHLFLVSNIIIKIKNCNQAIPFQHNNNRASRTFCLIDLGKRSKFYFRVRQSTLILEKSKRSITPCFRIAFKTMCFLWLKSHPFKNYHTWATKNKNLKTKIDFHKLLMFQSNLVNRTIGCFLHRFPKSTRFNL